MSLLPSEEGLLAKITIGTDNLAVGKAQLHNVVPYLQELPFAGVELDLVRGQVEG